jgi:putative flavoprotein involved in K+ transport
VVGGGQAGLAASRELAKAGVEHVVLERGRTGQTWRDRWGSFCLVSPNWTVQLPDHPYDGDDPDGYMSRDEIVAYLERYRDALGPPVREVGALSVEAGADGFRLETSCGCASRRSSWVLARTRRSFLRRSLGSEPPSAELSLAT